MKYKVSVLAGAVCYGILSTIVNKAYGQGYTLGEIVGSQLAVGFALSWLLVLVIGWLQRKANRLNPAAGTAAAADGSGKTSWRQRLLLMAAGMPTGATGLLYYESLRYVSNSLAILLLFQFTWIGVVVHAIVRRQRPNVATLLTIAVLFGGTLLAAGMLDHGLTVFSGMGLLFGLLAAASYTTFIFLSGKAVPAKPPAQRSAWMITGALLLVCVLFPPHFLLDGATLAGLLPFGLLLGLFGAFLPPVLFAFGVPHIGEGLAGILGAAELPVAVLLSSVVLHEQVSRLQWGGVCIVLLGVALPELIKKRRAPPLEAAFGLKRGA